MKKKNLRRKEEYNDRVASQALLRRVTIADIGEVVVKRRLISEYSSKDLKQRIGMLKSLSQKSGLSADEQIQLQALKDELASRKLERK